MNFKKLMFVFVFICISIFFIIYYIFSSFGNNKFRNQNEIVDNILNRFNNYEANILVTITTNKNENNYEMFQEVSEKNSKTIIKSPENIKDMIIEINDNTLKITNTKINMEKIYEEYDGILNNNLFLNKFAKDCENNNFKFYEKNEKIILETILNNNSSTYIKYKELCLDKKTNLPIELIMKDNTKKACIRIIYNDIKIK